MTISKFGRITPVQGFMLSLIGYSLDIFETFIPISDRERMEIIRWGRENLKRMTGQDFGYDLAAWHNFLLSNKEYGYKHPYAFSGVRKAVEQAIADAEHARVVLLLQEEEQNIKSNLSTVTDTLSSLIQRKNSEMFVIFEEQESRKFIQFTSSADEGLLLDLPLQILSPEEIERAKSLFRKLRTPKPRKNRMYTNKSLETIAGVQTSFQIKFGENVQQAVKVTLEIFERVYRFPPDFQLILKES